MQACLLSQEQLRRGRPRFGRQAGSSLSLLRGRAAPTALSPASRLQHVLSLHKVLF